jgi:hypothetical protein
VGKEEGREEKKKMRKKKSAAAGDTPHFNTQFSIAVRLSLLPGPETQPIARY